MSVPPRPLAPDALLALRYVQGASLAPGGERLLFVQSETDGVERFSIWLKASVQEEARRLPFAGDARAPSWSPDGRSIAFVGEGRLQIASAAKLSNIRSLAPDLAVAGTPIWHSGGEALFALVAGRNPDAEPDDGSEIRAYHYRADGLGSLQGASCAIARVGLATGEAAFLSDDGEHVSDPVLSPCGRWLVYLSARNAGRAARYAARLVERDLETGAVRVLLEGPWLIGCVRFIDERRIALTATDALERTGPVLRLWVLDRATGAMDERSTEATDSLGFLIHHDMPVAGFAWSNTFWVLDEAWALATVQRGGATAIWRIALEGPRRAAPVRDGRRSCVLLDAQPGQARFLFAATDLHQPLELRSGSLDSDEEQGLTRLNEAALRDWPALAVTDLAIESEDGLPLDGWYLARRDRAPPLPTILFIHGGPFSATGHAFRFDFHLLASLGFGLLFANFRGSPGYGPDFVRAIMGDWGRKGEQDHRATLDEAVRRGLADPARLGIWGASHGGFATCWMICRDRRFKAALAEASITDFASLYYTTDFPEAFARDLGGRPDEIPHVYRSRSPLTYATRCRTPLLLLHGEEDLRCPIGQAEAFHRALLDQGCEAVLRPIPGCSHSGDSFGPLAARVAQNAALADWFGQRL